MPIPIHDTSVYDADVDPSEANHAHAYTLAMVGWNKRVLELGCTGGHFTRALVKQACTVIGVEIDSNAAQRAMEWAEQVIVADLDDAKALSALDEGQFDAIVAGDVLEHLRDPMTVLRNCRRLLKATGFIVVSVPNIAHADVRLTLLDGAFPYRESGLLDITHLRFFTRDTIDDMLQGSGFVITEIERVVVPIFSSEFGVDRTRIPNDLIARILSDPDAETYQFVFKAVIDDANASVRQVSRLYQEAKAQLQATTREVEFLRNQLTESDARPSGPVAEQLAVSEARAEAAEGELAALYRTRLFRYAAPARRCYGSLRRLIGESS